MNDNVRAEVQYATTEGNVHSDLPPSNRVALHANLDEWLDRAEGSGFFYVADIDDLRGEFADVESVEELRVAAREAAEAAVTAEGIRCYHDGFHDTTRGAVAALVEALAAIDALAAAVEVTA